VFTAGRSTLSLPGSTGRLSDIFINLDCSVPYMKTLNRKVPTFWDKTKLISIITANQTDVFSCSNMNSLNKLSKHI
jgi:hypothetical protein